MRLAEPVATGARHGSSAAVMPTPTSPGRHAAYAAAGYRTLPSEPGGRRPMRPVLDAEEGLAWRPLAWQAFAPTQADIALWDRVGANLILRGDTHPGLDLDVDDPKLACKLAAAAFSALPALKEAPVRTRGAASSRLCWVLHGDGLCNRRLELAKDGTRSGLELLAAARSYTIEGSHHSGACYRWLNGSPLELPPPAVTEADMDRVFAAAEAAAAAEGWTVTESGARRDPHTTTTTAAPSAGVPSDATMAWIRRAMEVIAPATDRQSRLGICAALKRETGASAEGRELWLTWAAKAAGHGSPSARERAATAWDNLEPRHASLRTLWSRARRSDPSFAGPPTEAPAPVEGETSWPVGAACLQPVDQVAFDRALLMIDARCFADGDEFNLFIEALKGAKLGDDTYLESHVEPLARKLARRQVEGWSQADASPEALRRLWDRIELCREGAAYVELLSRRACRRNRLAEAVLLPRARREGCSTRTYVATRYAIAPGHGGKGTCILDLVTGHLHDPAHASSVFSILLQDALADGSYDRADIGSDRLLRWLERLPDSLRAIDSTYKPGGAFFAVDPESPGAYLLNAWRRPWQPVRGRRVEAEDVKPYLDHLAYLYDPADGSDGGDRMRDKLLGWLACRIQCGPRAAHVLAVTGHQGTGKDTLLDPVRHALGSSNYSRIDKDFLKQGFTDELHHKEIADLQDIVGLKRDVYNRHKPLVTDPYIQHNLKHGARFSAPNTTSWWATSNDILRMVEADADDRRWWIMHSCAYRKPVEYYDRLRDDWLFGPQAYWEVVAEHLYHLDYTALGYKPTANALQTTGRALALTCGLGSYSKAACLGVVRQAAGYRGPVLWYPVVGLTVCTTRKRGDDAPEDETEGEALLRALGGWQTAREEAQRYVGADAGTLAAILRRRELPDTPQGLGRVKVVLPGGKEREFAARGLVLDVDAVRGWGPSQYRARMVRDLQEALSALPAAQDLATAQEADEPFAA